MNPPAAWLQYATATQLAQCECANHKSYDNEGFKQEPHRCLMLDTNVVALLLDRDAAIAKRCCFLFRDKPERCEYFEKALLPVAIARQFTDYARLITPPKANGKPDKSTIRRTEAGLRKMLGAEVPDDDHPTHDCACGAPLLHGQRKCQKCAAAARKESYRRAKALKRAACSTVGVPQVLGTQESPDGVSR